MKKTVAAALLSAVVTFPAYADNSPYVGIKVGSTSVGFNALSKSSDTA